MATKDLLGLMLLPLGMLGGTLLCCVSKRIRDIFFLLLVFCAAITERMDVNFLSRDWYRGTTRGVEMSLVDVFAVSVFLSSFLFPRRGEKRWYWPASLGLMLLYLGYAMFSVAIADPKLFGLFELSKLFRGLMVFLAVATFLRTERELRMLLASLGAIALLQGVFGLKERYMDGLHRVPGLVWDPNSFSMYLCMTAPVFVAALNSSVPKWLKALSLAVVLSSAVCVILTISRTGFLTMAIVLTLVTVACMSWQITARKILVGVAIFIGATGVIYKGWDSLQSRFKESTLEKEYESRRGQGRGYYIRLAVAIVNDRPLGVGLNNWSYLVSNDYGPRMGWKFVPYRNTRSKPSEIIPPGANIDAAQAAPAHNLAALTLGELGYPGMLLLGLLWLRWFQMGAVFLWPRSSDPMRRIPVGILFGALGTFLQSLTEWVFRQSPLFFTFNILIGALAALYYVRRCERREAVETHEDDWEEEIAVETNEPPVTSHA